MSKILTILFIIICFTSCTSITALILGINQNYHGATTDQVIAYAKRYKYIGNGLYTLTKEATDSLRSNPYKPGAQKGERPVQCKVFNGNGKLIMFWASCEGPFAIRRALDSFPTRAVNYTDTNWTINKEIKTFREISDNSSFHLPKQKVDMYIIVYWATYLGSVDRKLVRDLKAYKRKHSDHNIEIILVNNDLISGVNYHDKGKKML